jgi:PPOX class probable F420-dependent enzyme
VALLTTEVREALTSGRLAHLVTINRDGSPQLTVVWVDVDGDEIVSGHFGYHHKLHNAARDPRVLLSLETGGRTPMGLGEYLVVRGTAAVTRGGAPELVRRLADRYLGADEARSQQWLADPPGDGYLLHITPTEITGVGPWGRAF